MMALERRRMLAYGVLAAGILVGAAGLWWVYADSWAERPEGDLHSSDPQQRIVAIQSLTTLQKSAAVAKVLPLMSDADPRVAAQAMVAVSQFRDRQYAPAFRAALADARPEIREAAAIGVGRCGGDGDVPAVMTLLKKDATPAVRAAAATALGELFVWDEGIKALLAAMRDPDPLVRGRAAGAVTAIITWDHHFDPYGPEAKREQVIKDIEESLPRIRHVHEEAKAKRQRR